MNYAINILIKELVLCEKALSKSVESFEAGRYSKELHETHKANLLPKIQNLKESINKLK